MIKSNDQLQKEIENLREEVKKIKELEKELFNAYRRMRNLEQQLGYYSAPKLDSDC